MSLSMSNSWVMAAAASFAERSDEEAVREGGKLRLISGLEICLPSSG